MNENDVYVKGKDKAITSLVLGIISVLSSFTIIGAIIGLITGIIGVIFANKAKKEGYYGGIQTSGFVSSLVGLIIGAIFIIFIIVAFSAISNLFTYAIPYSYGMYNFY